MLMRQAVDNSRDPTRHIHSFDIGLDELPQLLCYGLCSDAQGERLGWVEIEEDADEDDGHHHVHLMFVVHSVRMFRCLQWQREDVGGKMYCGETWGQYDSLEKQT